MKRRAQLNEERDSNVVSYRRGAGVLLMLCYALMREFKRAEDTQATPSALQGRNLSFGHPIPRKKRPSAAGKMTRRE